MVYGNSYPDPRDLKKKKISTMASSKSSSEQPERRERYSGHTESGRINESDHHRDGRTATPSPENSSNHGTHTGPASQYSGDLRDTVTNLKRKQRGARENSLGSEKRSFSRRNERNDDREQSLFSHLGSSQNTSHSRNGGDHHREETWQAYHEYRRTERKRAERRKREEHRDDRTRERRNYREKTPENNRETGNQNDLLRTIDDLKRRVEGEVAAAAGESPFTKRLENERKQRHLKHPNLDAYSGEGDPEDHLNQFDQLSKFYDYKDLTSCRFFATSLKGNAQRWFNKLPGRTIDTWEDFKKLFLSRFRTNKPHEVHTVYLESIRQGDREDL